MSYIITVKQLLDYCYKAADLGGVIEYLNSAKTIYGGKNRNGYVYGGQGEIFSKALAQAYTDAGRKVPTGRKKSTYFLVDCAKWFGRRVEDCSGLIVNAIRSVFPSFKDRTANTFIAECVRVWDVEDMPEIPGMALWKPGHIGVYVGDGWQIECRGTAWGTVKSRKDTQPWKKCGLLKGVDYSAVIETVDSILNKAKKRYGNEDIKVTKPFKFDEHAKTLQQDLITLDKEYKELVEKADGKYGDMSKLGVMQFQKDHNLSVTGIVDDKTKIALYDAVFNKGVNL